MMKDTEYIGKHVRKVFEECYKTHLRRVVYYAESYLNDREAAIDVSHEVFSTVWERRMFIDFDSDMLPFLIVLTRNRCLNRLKQRQLEWRYRQKQASDYEKNRINTRALEAVDDFNLYTTEINALMVQTCNNMPDHIRNTYIMHRFHEMKYSEIAEQEGVSVKAIEKLMMVALRILRKSLKDYLPDNGKI